MRNPWDRVVSRYFFAKKVIEVEKKEPVGKHPIDSFESFLEAACDGLLLEFVSLSLVSCFEAAFDGLLLASVPLVALFSFVMASFEVDFCGLFVGLVPFDLEVVSWLLSASNFNVTLYKISR